MVKPTVGDFVLRFPAASRAANIARYLPGFSAFVRIRPLNGTALTPRAPDRVSFTMVTRRVHFLALRFFFVGFTQLGPFRRPGRARLMLIATVAGSDSV